MGRRSFGEPRHNPVSGYRIQGDPGPRWSRLLSSLHPGQEASQRRPGCWSGGLAGPPARHGHLGIDVRVSPMREDVRQRRGGRSGATLAAIPGVNLQLSALQLQVRVGDVPGGGRGPEGGSQRCRCGQMAPRDGLGLYTRPREESIASQKEANL